MLLDSLERVLEAERTANKSKHTEREFRLAATTPFRDQGNDGWTCGYRNIQMLCGALLGMDNAYGGMLFGGKRLVPGVGEIQRWIEGAWQQGWDAEGAAVLGGSLVGKMGGAAWIGSNEALILLRSFGVRAFTTHFTGARAAENLAAWVWQYFETPTPGSAFRPPPIYFQHQGHSRTIIGAERRRKGSKEETIFLLWDPNVKSFDKEAKFLTEQDLRNAFSRGGGGGSHWQSVVKRGVHTLGGLGDRFSLAWVDACEGLPVKAFSKAELSGLKRVAGGVDGEEGGQIFRTVPNHRTHYPVRNSARTAAAPPPQAFTDDDDLERDLEESRAGGRADEGGGKESDEAFARRLQREEESRASPAAAARPPSAAAAEHHEAARGAVIQEVASNFEDALALDRVRDFEKRKAEDDAAAQQQNAQESDAIAASLQSSLREEKRRRMGSLGDEPGRECKESFQLQVTLPGGAVMKRRFRLSGRVQSAFDWIDLEASHSHENGNYKLRMMYPRQLLDDNKQKRFAEAGLDGGNHAAMFEAQAEDGDSSEESGDEGG